MDGMLQYGALGIVLVISMGLVRIVEAVVRKAAGNKDEYRFNAADALRLEEIHRSTNEMAKVLIRLADIQDRQARILERLENRR